MVWVAKLQTHIRWQEKDTSCCYVVGHLDFLQCKYDIPNSDTNYRPQCCMFFGFWNEAGDLVLLHSLYSHRFNAGLMNDGFSWHLMDDWSFTDQV